MPRAPVTNLAKHQLYWSMLGEVALTTIWTHDAVLTPAVRLPVERLVIRGWLTDEWAPIASNGTSATRIRSWNFGTTPPAPLGEDIINPPTTGLVTSPAAPNVLAKAVSLRTVIGPGGLRGRVYHPGIYRTQLSGNNITNSATIASVWDQLRIAFNLAPGSGDWVVVSFVSGGAFRITPIVAPIQTVITDSRVDVQRRRLPRQPAYF